MLERIVLVFGTASMKFRETAQATGRLSVSYLHSRRTDVINSSL